MNVDITLELISLIENNYIEINKLRKDLNSIKPTWIICGSCGQDTKTTWEKACNEGCPVCGYPNTEVYGSNPNE